MRHVCFIIFHRGMITVIDSVTSSLSSSVIGAYHSEIQQGAVGAGAEGLRCERNRGHLMGVNCNSEGMRESVCVCLSLIWLVPLCVMSVMVGSTVGALTVSIPLLTNNQDWLRNHNQEQQKRATHPSQDQWEGAVATDKHKCCGSYF